MFDQDFGVGSDISYRHNSFRVIKLYSGLVTESQPLQAILNFYKRNVKTRSPQKWKILADKDYINAQIELGYHSANIDALIGDVPQNNHILFKYKESNGYPNSENRLKYITEICKNLGFNVKSKGLFLTAILENKPKNELSGILTELTRLIASSKDLDLEAGLRDDEIPFAINSFLQGETDIYNLLRDRRPPG
jgi:hypothetical protein